MKTEKELFENAIDTTTINGKSIREYINKNYISRQVIEDIKAEILSLSDALAVRGQFDEEHALRYAVQIIDKHTKGGE